MENTNTILLWPFLVYSVAVVMLVGGILLISYFIGERHEEPETDQSYEGGIVATGSARIRFPLHFYIIAMFFVIFDLGTVFIITWSIAIRNVGWSGYIGILIFITIQISVLTYIIKIGALDFGPDGQKILKAYREKLKMKSL